MKKVVLALGLFAFLFAGIVTVDTAVANDTDKVVYDDPPKASKKSSKSCSEFGPNKSKCCSSKKADLGSKEDCKVTKEDTKTTSATTKSTTTKKDSPDKK
ncbi:MAG: hypothetical protein K8S16_01560 [Bacteroidales bacterium]|nr:hypothetical protein [Bacteroidales bacterium]